MQAGMRIVVLIAALALLAPAVARAGTYDVVSCRAPGAGGVNHSLAYAPSSFDPQYEDDAAGWYEADTTCADGLVARSRTVDGTFAKWLTGAGWSFTAPDGTDIVGFTSWRFGEARDGGGDDPNTPYVDEGEHWEVVVSDATGQAVGGPLGGETCSHGTDRPACTIGAPGGEPSSHRVVTKRLSWSVGCGGQIVAGCYTSFGGYPLATMVVYGTRVTLQDDSAPSASLAGSLLEAGWHRPTEPVSYTAADNSGIRSATLSAGPLTASDTRSCDYTYKVPCVNASGRALVFSGRLPDGRYPVTLTVTDAAGNPRTVAAPVAIDGTPPAVDLRRPRRRTIIVRVSDAASGFAGGRIDVRNGSAEPYRQLPTTFSRGALRARLDHGRAARTDVRVTVRDNAGNEAGGVPARFTLTSARSGKRRLSLGRGRVRAPFGRPVTLRGKLTLSAGQPLLGVPITALTKRLGGDSFTPESSAATGPGGRFALTLKRGVSRRVLLSYAGVGEGLPARRRLRLGVSASSSIRASDTTLAGAGTVSFSGRVRDAGAGLVVVLQGHDRGRWRTFADTRTRTHGRWRASYRFSGLPGSYPIRLRIRRQTGLAYDTGYSRRIVVRVS